MQDFWVWGGRNRILSSNTQGVYHRVLRIRRALVGAVRHLANLKWTMRQYWPITVAANRRWAIRTLWDCYEYLLNPNSSLSLP